MANHEDSPGGLQVLLRLYWMFFGNAILMFLIVFLLEKQPGFPAICDVAYVVTLTTLIAGRYVDIRFQNGHTADGTPATMWHWRRYAMIVGSVALSGWLLVRVLLAVFK